MSLLYSLIYLHYFYIIFIIYFLSQSCFSHDFASFSLLGSPRPSTYLLNRLSYNVILSLSFTRCELTVGNLVSRPIDKTLILASVLAMPLDRFGLGAEQSMASLTVTYAKTWASFRLEASLRFDPTKEDGCTCLEKTKLQNLAK